jgi:PHD/YefM family antitoxin component YafN of YafNO toxin-antitoxin module
MLDVSGDVRSSFDSKQSSSEFLRQLREAGRPVVLTIDGKAELVVQDARSYQELLELTERVEQIEALRISVAEMRAGKVVPIEEMLADMRQILDEKKAQ